MASSGNTVPVDSKNPKATTTAENGDNWKSIGELAASLVRGMAK